ncbi:MAG: haloacid dehalogenase [Ardenticatenaceae bacterium]|nr:haloacid dehalogenase [Anaerolineales bacterium]MCB8923865.1 haloacid dehalogenase [Ardenticatenaceae bacterium]MCB9003356.1 haloacid dehalogenase [Ardenticatenaceae bacterium]
MDQLDIVAEAIQSEFEQASTARDQAYQRSRALISLCARAIRAVHREEWETADSLIAQARDAANTLVDGVRHYPALYFAGYTQDAIKEFVEANLTYALIRNQPLPSPQELNAESNTWLNGLAEAATELRRRILDIIRHGHSDEAERLLDNMDQIYSILVTFDFNDSITGGLRRRTDTVRAVLERTRGDVTTSLRQAQLEEALEALEARLR